MNIIKAYHGTRSRFSKFEQSNARLVNDFYGGGVAYFTDNVDVAKSYAKTMYMRYSGEGMFVYETTLSFRNLFDVDSIFSGELLRKFAGDNPDQFARGAKLLKLGSDVHRIRAKLRDGDLKLTGHEVFLGLSNGMQNTSNARRRLISMGFDGLRYNGGQNMGMSTKHNVYLAYEANNITILNRYIVSNKLISEQEKREVYSYI